MNRDRVRLIEGTITLTDGSKSTFDITPDMGWSQWGADSTRLSRSVNVVDAMLDGLQNAGLMAEE